MILTRYDPELDDMVPVSQDWCDSLQHNMSMIALQREIARCVIGMNTVTHEEELRSIWEFIRGLGLAETIAESMEERRRQRELSRKISDGLNAELG